VTRRLVLSLSLLALVAALPASAREAPVVRAGEVRPGDLVVLGRDAAVSGTLAGTLVAVGGDVRVDGRVEKDVIALGGAVVLGPQGEVGGDLLAVGGPISLPEGLRRAIAGRVLSVGELEAAFAAELETSPVAGRRASGLLLAFRLVLLLLWLVIGLLLLRFLPRPVARAAGRVTGRLAVVGAVGAAAVLSSVLLSAFLLLALPARLGLLLAGLFVTLLGLAKAFGLAVVFVALGRRLTRAARRGSPFFGDPAALALGLGLLGLLSLLPVAGPLLWALVSLLAIGSALLAVTEREALGPVF
jgi:hypothetical protein